MTGSDGAPLDGYTVPDAETPARRARPWTLGLAFVFAVIQALLLVLGALFCFGLFLLWHTFGGSGTDRGRTALALWPLLALGLANLLLTGGFARAARSVLAGRDRSLLFICAAVSTALSILWATALRTDSTAGVEVIYLVPPLAAVIFAVHPRSTAYHRDGGDQNQPAALSSSEQDDQGEQA